MKKSPEMQIDTAPPKVKKEVRNKKYGGAMTAKELKFLRLTAKEMKMTQVDLIINSIVEYRAKYYVK